MPRRLITNALRLMLLFALYFSVAENAVPQAIKERHDVVTVGRASLKVTIRGEGDPVVFIPSLGRGVQDFDVLSKQLAQAGYRSILPEPRGIGGSTGPLDGITLHDLAGDVAGVIRATGGRPAIVVGHAFGNRIARMLATDHPTLVKQVILLAAGGTVAMSPDVEQTSHRVYTATLPKSDRIEAIQRVFFASGSNGSVWTEGWYLDVAAAQVAANSATQGNEWLGGGSSPILVLQGAEDIMAVPENSKRLAADYPKRVTVVEIPKAGHAMLPEQPDLILAAILAYLKR